MPTLDRMRSRMTDLKLRQSIKASPDRQLAINELQEEIYKVEARQHMDQALSAKRDSMVKTIPSGEVLREPGHPIEVEVYTEPRKRSAAEYAVFLAETLGS